MSLQYIVTYYPWITQNIQPSLIKSNIEAFFSIVETELSNIIKGKVNIIVLDPLDVPLQIKSITDGKCQIALMNPLGFVFANSINEKIKVVSIVERKTKEWGLTYYSQIYTNIRNAIKKENEMGEIDKFLNQFKNKSIGYGSKISTSNFLIPNYELYKRGLKTLTTFKSASFIGGHDTVALAVYNNQVDIGCGHDGVIFDLANQYGFGDASEKLFPLIMSDPITSDPVVVNISDVTEFKNLQEALEKASKTSKGEKIISIFWGGGRNLLPPTDKTNYDYLKRALKSLDINQNDILL